MTQLITNLVGLIREIMELSHNQDEIERLRIAETVLSCGPSDLDDFREALGHVLYHREERRVLDLLATPIERLDFSVRTYNCLKISGICTLGELAGKTEEQLISIRNFGNRSLTEVVAKLDKYEMKLQPNPVLLGDQFREELGKAIPDNADDG